eukprot:1160044-Pelagomonas_calceolata.AAC.1
MSSTGKAYARLWELPESYIPDQSPNIGVLIRTCCCSAFGVARVIYLIKAQTLEYSYALVAAK